MSSSLTNKVAIVTGASRGIGQKIAETLAQNGANIVVNYAHNKDQAEEIVRHAQEAGVKALAVRADVGKKADLEALFQTTLEHFDRLDILVNNAGIMTTLPIEQIT